MDLGSVVVDYRRKMGMNTSISEQKRDLDLYGSKLKALFDNMNIDYTIFKEGKRKMRHGNFQMSRKNYFLIYYHNLQIRKVVQVQLLLEKQRMFH